MATTPIKYRISSVATKPTTDSVKGAPLTSLEIDGNFRSLKESIEIINGSTVNVVATTGGEFDYDTTMAKASGLLLILSPVATIATYTVKLPATKIADGMQISVFAANQITALTVNGNGNTVKGAPRVMGADASFTLKYDLSTLTWYKI